MANAEFVSPSEVQKAADAPITSAAHTEVIADMMNKTAAKIPHDNGGSSSANAHLPGLTIDHGGAYPGGPHGRSGSDRSN
jgi:hypothetical protein